MKQGISQPVLLSIILCLAFFIPAIIFVGNFVDFAGETSVIENCRLSIIANSEIRGALLPWESAERERAPINCKMRPASTITLSNAGRGTSEVQQYTLIRLLADELKTTHYKHAGSVPHLLPFGESRFPRNYCFLDRHIVFEEALARRIPTITFLHQTLADMTFDTDENYLYYLYGVETPEALDERLIELMGLESHSQRDAILDRVSMHSIDTSQEYILLQFGRKVGTGDEAHYTSFPLLVSAAELGSIGCNEYFGR